MESSAREVAGERVDTGENGSGRVGGEELDNERIVNGMVRRDESDRQLRVRRRDDRIWMMAESMCWRIESFDVELE
jgi:hypothetical protein